MAQSYDICILLIGLRHLIPKKKQKLSKIAQQGTFQNITFIAQHFNIKYKQNKAPKTPLYIRSSQLVSSVNAQLKRASRD